jgi:hypothetical protein
MDTETTEAENTQSEKEAPRKSGRPPPVVMTSATNFIRLRSDLKHTLKDSTSSEIHEMEPVS